MAKVAVHAELMTQTVAARPVSCKDNFRGLRDRLNQPMLFSLGDEGIFYLIQKDLNGHNQLLSLNSRFNLPTSSQITAFSATQDVAGTIYVAFAANTGASSNDTIHIMAPISASFDWSQGDLTSQLLKYQAPSKPESTPTVKTVNKFLLASTCADDSSFPSLSVAYTNSNSMDDIAPLSIDPKAKIWTYSEAFVLPSAVKASQLLDVDVASVQGYSGIFALYNIASEQQIAWIGADLEYHTQFQAIQKPTTPGITCVAALPTPSGDTGLVFGGQQGLFYYKPDAVSKPNATCQTLSTDAKFAGTKQIYITTDSSVVCIWATNGNSEIVYQQFDATSLQPTTQPVLLLPSKLGGPFAALLHPTDGTQHLFVLAADGTMTLLEQSGVSKLWQNSLFALPATGINMSFNSYTINMLLSDANGLPLASSSSSAGVITPQVWLTSDGVINLTCNGRSFTVTSSGTAVSADGDGGVTLLLPTDDLSHPKLFISDMPHAQTTYFNGQSITIDPSKNVMAGLSAIKDGTTLKQKLSDAGGLPSGVTQTQLDKAAAAIALIYPYAAKFMGSPTASENGHPSASASASSAEDALWALWHGFENGAKAVWDFRTWVNDKLELVFMIVAEESLTVSLTNLEFCLKAIAWVLKTFLHIDLEALIRWLGREIGWQDIVDTQIMISRSIEKCMDCMIAMVPTWAAAAETQLTGLETKLLAALNTTLPSTVAAKSNSVSAVSAKGSSDSALNDAQNNPTSTFLNYNLKHGSMGQSIATLQRPATGAAAKVGSTSNDLMKTIDDAFSMVKNIVGDIAEGAYDLVKDTFTAGNMLATLNTMLKNIVTDACTGLRKLIKDGANLAVDFLNDLKDAFNWELPELPLITPLWGIIAPEQKLTLLNLVSLLYAVPATEIYKLYTKLPPSTMPEWSVLTSMLGQPTQERVLAAKNVEALPSNDDTMQKIAAALVPVIRFSGVISSLASIFFSVKDWADADEDPTLVGGGIAFVSAFLTFPFDIADPERPAIEFRVCETLANFANVPVLMATGNKVVRAGVLAPVYLIRGVVMLGSLVNDMTASTVVYPDLSYSTLWLWETVRVVAWVSDLANIVTLSSRGESQWSAAAYYALSFTSMVGATFNVAWRTSDKSYKGIDTAFPALMPV